MRREDLERALRLGEWRDLEFKEALNHVPRSAVETVSAFANTSGGTLVFGVSELDGRYIVSGVEQPDKVQNDFLSMLHSDGKLSHDVTIVEHRMFIDGRIVLTFAIAENHRTRKPVYIDGDIRRTFVRRGGGDFKAQGREIERMLRDAGIDRWDGQPYTRMPLKEALSSGSIRWYRTRFDQINPGFDMNMSDRDFLYHWGFLLRDGRSFVPTHAAIILFGTQRAIHQLLPRPIVDVQFLGYGTRDRLPETRWIDRIICEDNIIQAWDQLVSKYRFFMPKPFRSIDSSTLGRRDDPAGFRVFREAAVNLLIHQDYGDHTRKAVIKFYRDGIELWNPGDVFGDDDRLFEPGEKEVRNPAIAMGMRRISMCEQAGTGMRMMREEWMRLGHETPRYANDRARKSFELFIPDLDREADMASDLLRAMFAGAELTGERVDTANVPSLSQVCPKSVPTPIAMLVLTLAANPVDARALMVRAGQTNRSRFREQVLRPLIAAGLLALTLPDKPTSSKQRYILTDMGRHIMRLTASKE